MAKQSFSVGQVLTAAQMTSLQQTAMLGGAASAKTASYTLVAADAGTAISMTNASATTITVNTGLFAAGDTVQITNLGAGVCTITAGTATVNTSASLALAQYESGTLDFTSSSAAIFIKGAGAAAGGGGYTLLSTTTLSGGSTTISSIDQTYKHLYLVGNIIDDTNVGLCIRFNGDNTSGNYDGYELYCEVSGSISLQNTSNGEIGQTHNQTTFADKNYTEMFIPQYTEAINKKITSQVRYKTSAGVKRSFLTQTAYSSTTAISSIGIFPSSGNLSGTVYLYGVK
jgi:hypothetical protein